MLNSGVGIWDVGILSNVPTAGLNACFPGGILRWREEDRAEDT